MPRKQRFKPSRKPQPAVPAAVANPQVNEGAAHGDAQDIEKAAPERIEMQAAVSDIEGERY